MNNDDGARGGRNIVPMRALFQYSLWKRAFDIGFSLLALTVASPALLLVAAAVALSLGRPILFRQQRPGLNGKPFTMYKFRTMRDARDAEGNPLSDAERLTPLGQRLRKYSLDEVPEFLNVLKGDMSVVGPRPLLMQYLKLYSPRQMRRHEVRPGITGLAQVSGRNDLPWPEKLELDVRYVENLSLGLDLKVLARTLRIVATGSGVSKQGFETTDLFTGGEASETSPSQARENSRA